MDTSADADADTDAGADADAADADACEPFAKKYVRRYLCARAGETAVSSNTPAVM